MIALTRYHIRARNDWAFKQQQVRYSVGKMVQLLRNYQLQEAKDKDFQDNIFAHMKDLDKVLLEFTKSKDVLESERPEYLGKDFSGVTAKLEEVNNHLELATLTSKHGEYDSSGHPIV